MALVPDQKFSTFQNGGSLVVGDIIVGLRDGLNTRFNYTGELPPGIIVPIVNGGTGADNAPDARTNLGLGTMAVQNADAVAITGGTLTSVSLITSALGTPTSGVLTNCTGLPVPSGLSATGSPSATTFLRGDGTWATPAGTGVSSVSGTLNRITSTGGTTPVIDISASYVGQSSITTLGTVTTGVWNGTPIDLATYVTGNLAVSHLNSGTSASATTFWRGDGTWGTPAGTGVSSSQGTANQILVNATSGSPQTGAVTLTLPSTLIAPGTIAVGNILLDTNTLSVTNSNGNLNLLANGTGMVLLNNNTSVTLAGVTPTVEINNTAGGGLLITRFINSSASPGTVYLKSRGATINSLGSVQNGDILAVNYFYADDGSTYNTIAAATDVTVTASVSTGIVPTQFRISTMDTSGVLRTALALTNDQHAILGNPLQLIYGGSNAALTASQGGIVYSTSSAMAILSGTSTANLPLLSGSSAAPSWGAFALSLGGALTTASAHTLSGAFASTFTFTNTTSVTFPTSGTLATTSQIPTGAALTKTDDTNVTLTLGGSPTTALVNAASLTLGWTGQLALTRGGTNASLTASNGGIVYSTASALAILAGTATAGQMLQSGASTTPSWSTATYPATVAQGDLLYGSATNVISNLTKDTNATRYLSNTGTTNNPAWAQVNLANGVTGNLPVTNLNSGTSASSSTFWRGDGTWVNPNTGSGGLKSFQIFTSGSAATYTRPAGITSILVEVVGGGGGSGGVTGGAAGAVSVSAGGGGGGYARLFVASASSTYTYTVGAGGTAGSSGNNAGGIGGTTTFSASSLQATGGNGGAGDTSHAVTLNANTNLGTPGGVGSNGNINVTGSASTPTAVLSGTVIIANGGSSYYGGAKGGPGAGVNYGGGAAGNFATTTNAAGFAGADGIIIVWEFS